MLRNEARIAMQLSHKHIVRLHNLQEYDGGFYMVMEYIDGCTFRDILKAQTKLPLATVMQVAGICADAIGYAHRRNVLHRDIKPDNLMLTRDGVLKVIDFGLACLSHPACKTETISGTPMYISPEECQGNKLDQRSDIFSLAVTLHELITGHMPTTDGARTNDLTPFCPVISSFQAYRCGSYHIGSQVTTCPATGRRGEPPLHPPTTDPLPIFLFFCCQKSILPV